MIKPVYSHKYSRALRKSIMKLKRKLLAGLLTLCMTVGMAVPVFAVEGTPLTSAGGELTDSSYYLDQDVTLNGQFDSSGERHSNAGSERFHPAG